jgi:release factor glutamine methyltransferase
VPTPLDSPAAVAAALAAIGCVAPEEEARLLWDRSQAPDELAGLVARRGEGVPLEVLVGYADFAGVRVRVDPGVFLPRPRSELLARSACDEARRASRPVVADVCCGTGALAAVVASTLPEGRFVASDLAPAAVACAEVNGATYGFEVVRGDLCDALPTELRRRVDVLVANVPHVPTSELPLMPRDTRAHEPVAAHDGGPDGLDVLRRLAAQAGAWLADDGALLVEVADHQVDGAAAALGALGFAVDSVQDPEERTSVVRARQRSRESTSASAPER